MKRDHSKVLSFAREPDRERVLGDIAMKHCRFECYCSGANADAATNALRYSTVVTSGVLPTGDWTAEEVQVYADLLAEYLAGFEHAWHIEREMVTPLVACMVTPEFDPLPSTVTNLHRIAEMGICKGQFDLEFLSLISRFHEPEQP